MNHLANKKTVFLLLCLSLLVLCSASYALASRDGPLRIDELISAFYYRFDEYRKLGGEFDPEKITITRNEGDWAEASFDSLIISGNVVRENEKSDMDIDCIRIIMSDGITSPTNSGYLVLTLIATLEFDIPENPGALESYEAMRFAKGILDSALENPLLIPELIVKKRFDVYQGRDYNYCFTLDNATGMTVFTAEYRN